MSLDITTERAAKLVAVARAIEPVLRTLDRHAETCTACGLAKSRNWDESQIYTELAATQAKLGRLAERLDRLDAGRKTPLNAPPQRREGDPG